MGDRKFLRKQTIKTAVKVSLKLAIPALLGWIGIDYVTDGQVGGIAEAASELIAEIASIFI